MANQIFNLKWSLLESNIFFLRNIEQFVCVWLDWFFSFIFFETFFFCIALAVLELDSWSWICTCLCFLGAEIKDILHHSYLCFDSLLMILHVWLRRKKCIWCIEHVETWFHSVALVVLDLYTDKSDFKLTEITGLFVLGTLIKGVNLHS